MYAYVCIQRVWQDICTYVCIRHYFCRFNDQQFSACTAYYFFGFPISQRFIICLPISLPVNLFLMSNYDTCFNGLLALDENFDLKNRKLKWINSQKWTSNKRNEWSHKQENKLHLQKNTVLKYIFWRRRKNMENYQEDGNKTCLYFLLTFLSLIPCNLTFFTLFMTFSMKFAINTIYFICCVCILWLIAALKIC